MQVVPRGVVPDVIADAAAAAAAATSDPMCCNTVAYVLDVKVMRRVLVSRAFAVLEEVHPVAVRRLLPQTSWQCSQLIQPIPIRIGLRLRCPQQPKQHVVHG